MAEMDSPSGRQLPGGAVNSWNEWDPLEGVIVGSARGAVEMADEPSLAPYCLPGQPAGGSARIPQVVVDDAECVELMTAFVQAEPAQVAQLREGSEPAAGHHRPPPGARRPRPPGEDPGLGGALRRRLPLLHAGHPPGRDASVVLPDA